jgi:glycosyltransferase involved in cell wall biosynthesis
VVQPGVSEEFTPQSRDKVEACLNKYKLKTSYLLAVGTREPRKNFELLVESFLKMKAEGLTRGHTLVLAGNRGWKDRRLCKLLKRGASDGVIVLDYVDQRDLAALYTGADALICPSLYEGFGMPVLEARACGTRVVASDIPELREAGGDEAVYITPNGAGIREGILAVVNDGAALKARVDRLATWEDGAEVLAKVLTGAIGCNAG